jgi:hypothetical protein
VIAEAPSETTSTMLWQFQVFYVLAHGPQRASRAGEAFSNGGPAEAGTPNGELRSMLVRAESAAEAQWHLEQAGLTVTSVGTGFPVIDWSKPYFNREEAKCFVMLEDSEFSKQVRAGKIQQSAGRAVYSRVNLDRYLNSHG